MLHEESGGIPVIRRKFNSGAVTFQPINYFISVKFMHTIIKKMRNEIFLSAL